MWDFKGRAYRTPAEKVLISVNHFAIYKPAGNLYKKIYIAQCLKWTSRICRYVVQLTRTVGVVCMLIYTPCLWK